MINKFLGGVSGVLRKNFAFFLMIFLLGVIPTLLDIFLHETKSLIKIKAVCTISYVFFVSYWIVFFCDKFWKKRWLEVLFLSIWIFLFVIEFVLLFGYDTLLSPSIIFVLANTNKSEVLEFFSFALSFRICMWGIFLFVFLSGMLWGISRLKVFPFLWRKQFGWGVLALLLIGGSVFGYSFHRLPSIIFYRVITPFERMLFSVWRANKDLDEMENALTKNRFSDPCIVKNESEIKNIVIILGESLSKSKMGCYGYYLNTTPLLNQRVDEGNALLFADVIAPYGVTSECVKSVLTSYNAETTSDWLESEVLSDAMEKAGYVSYWISNQESFGVFANLPVMISKRFDKVKFTRVRNSSEEKYGTFDEKLLPLVKDVLNDSVAKRFIVIHMMGSHTRYKYRYPVPFGIFSKDDVKNKALGQAEVISEYANSVLYTDFVVNSILDLFEREDALVFFFSDHGEEVYDFRDFAGHGMTKSSRYMAEIPFVVWYSDIFKQKYQNKINCMKSSMKYRFMTDDFYFTLLDIAGIKTLSSDSTRSLFNPCFGKERMRIFNGNIDYDKELKNKN